MTTLRLLNSSAEVSPSDLSSIVPALQTYLGQVAAAWGLDTPTVIAGSDGQAASDWLLALTDDTPEPGDLGYHTDLGVPNAVIQVTETLGYGGSILQPGSGNPAVSAVVSHEAAEMLVDPLATMYVPLLGSTSQVAMEVCDPVQGDAYDIGEVSVSDFVTPGWFLNIGKADQLGVATGSKLRPGGYYVLKAEDGSTSSVMGERCGGLWKVRAQRHGRRR